MIGLTTLLFAAACHHEVSGSSLLVDLRPANSPALVGALHFELLALGRGKACAVRDSGARYWVGMADLAAVSRDWLTRQAIAAALLDAASRLDDVDSIMLTSVVTEAKGRDKVCATVTGHGVRFVKAGPATGQATQAPSSPSAETTTPF
jgi:hypothetical protein